MNRLFLIILLAASTTSAEPRGPFYSPITGFSDALVPILTSFEKAIIKKTLRGFIARADSSPAFKESDTEPSERGLYLNVAVRDSEEVETLSDHTEQKGALNHRFVRIPPPKGGEQAIVIRLDYGRQVPAEAIRAIDTCITRVIEFSKRPTKP